MATDKLKQNTHTAREAKKNASETTKLEPESATYSKHSHSRKPEEYSEVIRTAKSQAGPLAAFLIKPKQVKFDSQDKEEKILLLLRRHFITNIPWIVGVIAALLMPIIATYIPAFMLLPGDYQVITIAIWYLVIFGVGFEQFLSWYFHVYIVTDERIIDYDFYSLIYKRVSKAKIDNIEDVTYEMGGVLASFFHYGNVYIQTAGEKLELDFEQVPNPELVSKLLNELMLEEEREKLEGRVR